MAKEEGDKGCCGSGCCSKGRALTGVVLLLVGGVVGYLINGRCMMKNYCPVSQDMTAPPVKPGK